MKIKIITIILISIIFPNKIFANTKFFQQGLDLYNEKKYNEAKFKFEQDLVINPKSEMSYLYLSKIADRKLKKTQYCIIIMLMNIYIYECIKEGRSKFTPQTYKVRAKRDASNAYKG